MSLSEKLYVIYLKPLEMGFAQFLLSSSCLSVFSYVLFGPGQGVHNFYHLGWWKDDRRFLKSRNLLFRFSGKSNLVS